jgi:hypothetical protein
MQADETSTKRPERTVHDEATRLLGSKPDASLTDQEVKRLIVREFVDDGAEIEHPDAYVDAAFRTLIEGDPRMPMTRRRMRLAVTERQRRMLEQTQPEGLPN